MDKPQLLARLDELGLELPAVARPLAAYQPAIVGGGLVFVSGQLPLEDGELTAVGPTPSAVPLERAQGAARRATLNGLAAVDLALDGDWGRFSRVVRVGVFVNSDPGFTEQHLVANGASDLLFDVLGEPGRHARAAVGVNTLPLGAAVEVELVVEAAVSGGA